MVREGMMWCPSCGGWVTFSELSTGEGGVIFWKMTFLKNKLNKGVDNQRREVNIATMFFSLIGEVGPNKF